MEKDAPAQWKFRINAEMLPSYIPTRVADKVCNFLKFCPLKQSIVQCYLILLTI